MNGMLRLGLAAAVLASTTGCFPTIRSITAQTWDGDGKGVYVAYWEGIASPFAGPGDGHVSWCTLNADNSLSCTKQESVDSLLDRKYKAAK
jgi:hypothetical protein